MPVPLALGAASLFKVAIAWFVANVLGKIVYRVAFALGIGVILFTGGEIILDTVISQMGSNINSLPTLVKQVFSECKVGEGISIITSASVYAATFRFARASMGFVGKK